MSENVLTRMFAEIEDARLDVHKAMEMAHKGRGEALDANCLPMAKLLKEIEYLLKNVLEE